MQFINHTTPKLLIADQGYKLRDINDVERDEELDDGTINHIMPYYSDMVFIADGVSEEEARALYVEVPAEQITSK